MAMNCGKNDGSFCPPAKVLGKPMSADACEALCKADGECTVWTWHDANQGVWSYECVTRTDGLWAPTEEVGHMSGRRIGPVGTAYVADVSTAGVDDINSLRVDGARATRARYPNVSSQPILLLSARHQTHTCTYVHFYGMNQTSIIQRFD
jgi:hypothetical protein